MPVEPLANAHGSTTPTSYSHAELAEMLFDVESDLVERKETFGGDARDSVRRAICAFANDLPNHRRAGVIFIGARDDGTPAGLEINDALLLKLAHCKTDGNILPLPTMTVHKHAFDGGDIAVITVTPADSPPVRYRGRICIRIGPRRALASAQDERILNEKRCHADTPFDVHPLRAATLDDLDLRRFELLYLPEAFSADVLEKNDRTIEERLAATKMIASVDEPVPTVLGMLVLGRKPTDFLPGAYVQFLRIAGEERGAPIIDSARIDEPLGEAMSTLDTILRAHVRTSVEVGTARTEIRHATYPLPALQELVRNAVMHRGYESGQGPVQVYWFNKHIEIINPGGAYGDITPENFGQPGLVAYRNPNLADAMRVTGLVQRYGFGIPLARRELLANQQEPPEYRVDGHWVRCTVHANADWLGFRRGRGAAQRRWRNAAWRGRR